MKSYLLYYLIQLYSFVKGFEQYVYPRLDSHFFYNRKRKYFIEEDLKALGIQLINIGLLKEAFF
jgi:hypothetical protein